jgi:hypothetical protein
LDENIVLSEDIGESVSYFSRIIQLTGNILLTLYELMTVS